MLVSLGWRRRTINEGRELALHIRWATSTSKTADSSKEAMLWPPQLEMFWLPSKTEYRQVWRYYQCNNNSSSSTDCRGAPGNLTLKQATAMVSTILATEIKSWAYSIFPISLNSLESKCSGTRNLESGLRYWSTSNEVVVLSWNAASLYLCLGAFQAEFT